MTLSPERDPRIYEMAEHVARLHGVRHLLDVGCGDGAHLAAVVERGSVDVIGLDADGPIELCRQRHSFGTWVRWPPADEGALPEQVLADSVLVSSSAHPLEGATLAALDRHLGHCPVAVVAGPSVVHLEGRPSSLVPIFHGKDSQSKVAIADRALPDLGTSAPPSFRVVALMTVFNEADIIRPSVQYLISQGIDVCLIDNWSTDDTISRVQDLVGHGIVGIERFPSDGPSTTFDLGQLLDNALEVARSTEADWFVLYDADESRASPWPGVRLRDAIYLVDRAGFNAIDHTLMEFRPVNDEYVDGADFVDSFRYFEFMTSMHRKTWKKTDAPIDIRGGGHEVCFPGRRVFPYNFLLRHYPVRTQAQGMRKVFRERVPRYNASEVRRGWHSHYAKIKPGHHFLRDPSKLLLFDDDFFERYLFQRVARIGIVKSPPPLESRARLAGVALLRRLHLLEPALAVIRRYRRRRTDRTAKNL